MVIASILRKYPAILPYLVWVYQGVHKALGVRSNSVVEMDVFVVAVDAVDMGSLAEVDEYASQPLEISMQL